MSQALTGENVTQTVIQKRHTNGCSIPNILKRGDRYCLHFRLPLGGFFRVSLGCDSASRARFISSRLSVFISLVKSSKMEPALLLDIVHKMKKLEQKDIDDYLLSIQAAFYSAAKKIPTNVRKRLRSSTSLTYEKSNVTLLGEVLGDTFTTDGPALSEDSVIEHLSRQYDITGMAEEIDYIASEYDLMWKHYCDAHVAFLDSRHSEYRQILSSLRPENDYAPAVVDKPEKTLASELTVSQAWKGFLEFKSDWKPKIRQGNEKYFEVIEAVLGADTIVNSITRRDIKNLLEMAEGLPQQNKKPYNRMTTQECLDADDIPENDLVSSRTVNGYLKLCQGLFAYLVKEEDVLESSPTSNVKYEAKSRSYGNYSLTEMRKLVAYFTTLEDWKKWVFLLLAYTGARRSEIAALKVSDIRLDDDSQRYYIMIQDSKTDAGIRQIPLSLCLVDMGFLSYLKNKNPDARLFPEVTNKTQLTRIFHGMRETLNIHYLDDFKRRRIIHSLRHTFITEAAKTNNLPLVQRTVGHELTRIGQTQVYIHEFNVSALLPVIDCIDWLK